MATDYTPNLQKAYDFLVASQNSDGGWGYRRGGMSYVEPTAFALLALFSPIGAGGQNVADARFQAVLKGLAWLRAQQHEDGGWGVMREDTSSSWMTYPIVWMFNVLLKIPELFSYYGNPDDKNMRDRGRNWILNRGREGTVDQVTYDQVKSLFRIDSNLRGFGWSGGEAGWVIPTSLAMVALVTEDNAIMPNDDVVINAKDYLRDRACPDGGWNVGNPWMIGKKLPPTADATSFALVAWRLCLTATDFGTNVDTVNAAIDYLDSYILASNSDHSVALCAWALGLFKQPSEVENYRSRLAFGLMRDGESADRSFTYRGKEIKKRTVQGQDKTTGAWANSAYTTAIAAFALSDNRYYLEPK
jgi:hypothetical protein